MTDSIEQSDYRYLLLLFVLRMNDVFLENTTVHSRCNEISFVTNNFLQTFF